MTIEDQTKEEYDERFNKKEKLLEDLVKKRISRAFGKLEDKNHLEPGVHDRRILEFGVLEFEPGILEAGAVFSCGYNPSSYTHYFKTAVDSVLDGSKNDVFATDNDILYDVLRYELIYKMGILAKIDQNLYKTLLQKSLTHKNKIVRFAAATSIGEFSFSEEYIPLVENFLRSKDHKIRAGLMHALKPMAKLNPSRFVEFVQHGLKDKNGYVREIAAKNLDLVAEIDRAKFYQLVESILSGKEEFSTKEIAFEAAKSHATEDKAYFLQLVLNNLKSEDDSCRMLAGKNMGILAAVDLALYLVKFDEFLKRKYDAEQSVAIWSLNDLADINQKEYERLITKLLMDKNIIHGSEIKRAFSKSVGALAKINPSKFVEYAELSLNGKLGGRDDSPIIENLWHLAELDTKKFVELLKESGNTSEKNLKALVIHSTEDFIQLAHRNFNRDFAFALNHLAQVDLDAYIGLVQSYLQNCRLYDDLDKEIWRITTNSISVLGEMFKNYPGEIFKECGAAAIKAIIESSYLKPSEEIIDMLDDLVFYSTYSTTNNWKGLQRLVADGKCNSLGEIIECSKINIPNHLVLKNLGAGAIKKAYLAKNTHSGGESVFLMINPNSKGFNHYRQLHKNLTEEALRQRIYHDEFSGARLRDLEDPRYIALVSQPIEGKDDQGQSVYFMEIKKYEKTLEDVLKEKIDLDQALKYFQQMALALENCHKVGIVHKDLKPDNIGITAADNILLSDFGCTSMFSENSDARYQCPLDLRPPELAYSEEHWTQKGVGWQSDLFTPEANVWSVGAIFYRMVMSKELFKRPEHRAEIGTEEWKKQNEAVYQQIRNFEVVRPQILAEVSQVNQYVSQIIDLCLRTNPEERKGALEKCNRVLATKAIEEIFSKETTGEGK